MAEPAALRVAIDLLHVPSRLRLIRSSGLPEGVTQLLRIAAGDQQALVESAATAERPPDIVREAATFFVEQVLLCPGADSYRVLGATSEASSSELRHNMALLMRWLHPDMPQQAQHAASVRRVTMAWEDLKTPERRLAYDQKWRAQAKTSRRHGRGGRSRALARAGPETLQARSGGAPVSAGWGYLVRRGLLRRAALFLLGGPKS